MPVSKGEQQGSVLGPLQFTLYINGLPKCLLHSDIHIYADDVQISTNCKKDWIDDYCAKLNEDLDRIHYWTLSNGLHLNQTKLKDLIMAQWKQNIVVDISITSANWNILIDPIEENKLFNNNLLSELQFFINTIRLRNSLPKPLQTTGNALELKEGYF